MATVDLFINANTKQAQKAVTTFSKTATKSLANVEKSFKLLGVAAAGLVGILAGRKVISAIQEWTAAAAIQEDAINALNIALSATGQFTEEASQSFQDFASSIQQATKFGDEAILENAALIQSLGKLNQEGLKEATQAAVDLASALKIDLRSASLLVGKAAAGEVSSFSRYGLVIQKGASNAETFAKTLQAINDRFGGAAAAAVNTYSGAIQQLTNTQGDLNEELGFTITKSPIVITAIKSLNSIYQELIEIVKNNRESIQEFIRDALIAIANAIPKIIRSLGFLARGFNALKLAVSSAIVAISDFLRVLLEFETIKSVVNTLTDAFTGFISLASEGFAELLDLLGNIPGVSTAMSALGIDIDEAAASLRELAAGLDVAMGDDVTRDAVNNLTQMREAALDFGAEAELTDKKIRDLTDAAADFAERGVKKFVEAVGKAAKSGDGFATNFAESVESAFGKINFEDALKGAGLSTSVQTEIGKGLQAALTGAKGAQKFGAQLTTVFTDVVGQVFGVTGLGAALGPVFQQLAGMTGDQARQAIREFAEALPDVIVNIVEALIASADEIVEALVNSLIVKGGIVRIAVALAKAMPAVAQALAQSLVQALKQALQGLAQFLLQPPPWLDRLKIPTPPWLRRLERLFGADDDDDDRPVEERASTGVRGVTDLLSFGLQSGGMVPKGFPRDQFPAALSSGELVIPADTTENLFRAIDRLGSQDSNMANAGLMSQILAAVTAPITVETTAEVNNQAFADIILTLNRQNARLA